jgi:hypothetical protein
MAPLCLEDVHAALSGMANHKALGADGLPIELLKYSGPSGLQILLLLFNLIHDRECIPQGWRAGKTVSVPKSGDHTRLLQGSFGFRCNHGRSTLFIGSCTGRCSDFIRARTDDVSTEKGTKKIFWLALLAYITLTSTN